MITRDPVRKETDIRSAVQCSAEIYLQWIESASVVIYSGVRV